MEYGYSYLEQTHVEEKLENCENWQINIYRHLEWLAASFYVLAANDRRDKESVRRDCHDLQTKASFNLRPQRIDEKLESLTTSFL